MLFTFYGAASADSSRCYRSFKVFFLSNGTEKTLSLWAQTEKNTELHPKEWRAHTMSEVTAKKKGGRGGVLFENMYKRNP